MNNEIKEILDIENYRNKDGYVENINLLPSEIHKLSDYITNLHNELKYQKEMEDEYIEKHTKLLQDFTNLQNKYENQIHRYKNLKDYATNLQEEIGILRQNAQNLVKKNDELEEIIDKAIEYIKDNTYEAYGTDYMDLTGIKELLNILNGGDE